MVASLSDRLNTARPITPQPVSRKVVVTVIFATCALFLLVGLLSGGSHKASALGSDSQDYSNVPGPLATEPPSLTPTRTPSITPGGPTLSPTGTPTSTATPPPNCWQTWRPTESIYIGDCRTILNGIATLSPTDIWAVGSYDAEGTEQSLVGHWNGNRWDVFSSPNVGMGDNILYGVTAISASEIWAVGYYLGSSPSYRRPLTIHWDGTQWSLVTNTIFGAGYGVSASSSSDVWVVGDDSPFDTRLQTLHSRGASRPSGLYNAISMHWDGNSWQQIAVPPTQGANSTLADVVALAPNNAWAVGSDSGHTLVLHWDGTAWSRVSSPSNGYDVLTGITTISANDIWASGIDFGADEPLIEHWDGTQWAIVPQPITGRPGRLWSISAESTDNVWAVGNLDSQPSSETLVLHWDGANWEEIPSANVGTGANYLFGVAPASERNIWTVGLSGGFENARSLAEYYVASFSDVQPTDYFYEAVQALDCRSAISGYSDATFRPSNLTTRGQFCKILVLAMGWLPYTPSEPTFTDVPDTNPFFPYIERAYFHRIISGYGDGTFRPGNNVTRGQTCKIVVLAEDWTISTPSAPTFTDVPANHAFYQYVETAFSHNIISGYANHFFLPGNNATRGQISKIVFNAITAP